ncbi:cytochrome P450 [Dendrothele bispora CBS 962.96]|uniref:Cytochrome P450 n=1 Tax=Dendrothele bispora (strain CBS 962.96) TaxID=1314807 RepID=A0A4S8LFN5_DENBC|nr:cytochrome P450 [Dendrothele bispora CBS 962.96]
MATQLLWTLGLGVLVVWAVRTWIQYSALTGKAYIRRLRGLTTFFANVSYVSAVLRSSSTLCLGHSQIWFNIRRWYETSGWDVSAAISLFPRVKVTYFVSDPTLSKEITSSRTEYPKSTEQYDVLRFFGRNIVTEEGEEWKKYKKICAPAFSERNNRLVWDYTLRIISDFFEEVWLLDKVPNDTEVVIEDFKIPSTQFTLRILVAAAFGQLLPWKNVNTSYTSFSNPSPEIKLPTEAETLGPENQTVVTSSEELAIEEIFEIISQDLVLKLVIPDWLLRNAEWAFMPFGNLRNRAIKVRKAFEGLKLYMQNIITARTNGITSSDSSLLPSDSGKGADLFSNLIEANENDGALDDGQVWDPELGEYVDADAYKSLGNRTKTADNANTKLTDVELMGNIFIFLLGGHETTAHTVCYALALLALYQDEQEKLFQHIISVCPDGQMPTYEDLPRLTRTMAVMQETLRLYPPVIGIPKKAANDTSFTTKNPITEEKLTIPIEKGTQFVLHVLGAHYWNDPTRFNPDRFMPGSNWPRDAFLPFSAGARSCLGKRFAEVESVAIISLLILKYKVRVKEEEQFKNETFEERKERVLNTENGITLTPVRVPLVFTQRE